MKRFLIVFILFIISLSKVFTQWQYVNPVPHDYNVSSVYFLNSLVGWEACNDGKILKTIDGGISWILQNSGTEEGILSIQFINENVGFAAGWNGFILKTTNGGQEWITKTKNLSTFFYSMSFIDDMKGWVAGYGEGFSGVIFYTIDGGENWILQYSLATPIYPMYFINEKLGWVVAVDEGKKSSKIIKTTNGGSNWIETTILNNILGFSIFFTDSLNGFIGTSDQSIYSTEDGGLTWKENFNFNSTSGGTIHSFSFTSLKDGWASGINIPIVHTTDGGKSWIKNDLKLSLGEKYQIRFIDKMTGWLFAESRGTAYKTTDGGQTWLKISKDIFQGDLLTICFTDKSNGFIGGNGFDVFKTTDSGVNWTSFTLGFNVINRISFYNNEFGWIAGQRLLTPNGIYLYGSYLSNTTDAGITWNQKLNTSDWEFTDVKFVSTLLGWCTGSIDGLVYKTVDGGNNWILQGRVFGLQSKPKLCFLDENIGWVGALPNLFYTSDGGTHWNKISSEGIWNFQFISKNTGFAIAGSKELKKTTDGGNTWNTINIPHKSYFLKVFFIAGGRGVLLGQKDVGNGQVTSNEIFVTTDGGNNWLQKDTPPTINNLTDIFLADKYHCWVTGAFGVVMYNPNLFEETDSTFNQDQELPNTYLLNQNYPNPFNSSTQITYSIPQKKIVNISVFDLLGRKITELINEEKEAGNYSINYNPSHLSSGIYFYQLLTDEILITKKFVLLK